STCSPRRTGRKAARPPARSRCAATTPARWRPSAGWSATWAARPLSRARQLEEAAGFCIGLAFAGFARPRPCPAPTGRPDAGPSGAGRRRGVPAPLRNRGGERRAAAPRRIPAPAPRRRGTRPRGRPRKQGRLQGSSAQLAADPLTDLLGVQVDVVQRVEEMPCLVLVGVEGAEVLLRPAVETQPRDRLPVVVVQEDREVRLGVAVRDPLRFDLAARDRFDDPVALQLLEGGLDAGVPVRRLLGLLLELLLLPGRRKTRTQGRLQPPVHLVIEELRG